MEIDPDVLEMVREQLERDPPPSTAALYGRAAHLNEDIYELSLRQFHALYPLRVKREQARGPAAGGTAAGEEEPGDEESPASRPTYSTGPPLDPGSSPDVSGVTLTDGARSRIRAVLRELARDVAAADSLEALDAVIGGLPDRADRIASILVSGR